ncbi:MAG TPA: aldo/keto reductase [Kofleriaceae bacterium]|jgi:aryl-alcohol dehydrogenase-like predicted oxidoreductase|nr:aldo/keto reductase [Kofleriaceae bacterium]
MERRPLGRTGIEVSVVGQGTYKVFNVSGDAAEARCGAVVDAALSAGACLFDSSPMYGNAERVLAGALADRRDEAVVATKVWARTRAQGEEQIEQALDWFERVELYQVHNLLAIDEHLPYLRHLQQAGRVRAVGITHYLPSALPDMVERIKRHEIDAVQVPYHPLERSVEAQLLPEAHACGVGVIVMSPLGSGRLLERLPTDEQLAPLAPFGVFTWAQALLKWILSDPRVTAAIPATSSPERMRENAAAGSPPWYDGDARTYVRQLAERL